MTPTFSDDYFKTHPGFTPIQNEKEAKETKLEELKRKICNHLDRQGILNDKIRLELIKIIMEEDEWF